MEQASGWKYTDFVRLPDDELRYELFEGVLVHEPPPTAAHQRIVSRLVYLLGDHLGPSRREGVLTSPIAVVLSPRTVLQPDLLYISPNRFPIIMEDAVHGAPDVVIEVLSPSTRE
jgi:Uma2 family endonuclease